jgi:methylated-DNA-[protein]-cysteine S-methyltransferase
VKAKTSFAVFETDLGPVAVAWTERGVTRLVLPEKNEQTLRARLRAADASEADPPPPVRAVIEQVTRHLAGTAEDFSRVELDLDGVPPFHARVYRAALGVPSGTTTTYGALAETMGAPGSQRAIGQALGRNPLAVIVPCHRVLGAKGSAGGFSAFGGVTTKSKLLLLEERAASGLLPSRVPFDTAGAARDLAARDPAMARLIERIGPPRLRVRPAMSLFEALAESIVYQQLSGKAASTIYARVRFAVRPFDAANLARTRDAKLRAAGLSASKVLALRDLARKTLDGELPDLAGLSAMSDDDIRASLTRVRGIGTWTVDMILLFRLGRPDVWPVGDLGVRKGFALALGRTELPDEEEMNERSAIWRPYRSLVAWYLWRRTDLTAPPTTLA